MAVEMFARAAGIDLMHVPYRGGAPALTDAIGGQVPLIAVNALEVLPHARSGKLKVLAVLSAQRSPNFPDVPTMAESGFPGFGIWCGTGWWPCGHTQGRQERLHAGCKKPATKRCASACRRWRRRDTRQRRRLPA
jgi:tripartite-type tricarboxylate transporter receptor subunit TctC